MKKDEYVDVLRYDNKNHIDKLWVLIRELNFKIEKLKQSKLMTDNIMKKFDIEAYEYNMVDAIDEMYRKIVQDLEKLILEIQKISARNSRNVDDDIKKMNSMNDLLYTYEVQLNAINKNNISDVEKLQLNAVKKEIYEKFLRARAEIDKAILMEKYNRMQNTNFFAKAVYKFFAVTEFKDSQKENLFVAIKGIDDCISGLKQKSEPTREYKIVDILADVNIYLAENTKYKKYEKQYNEISLIRDKIFSSFSIDRNELIIAISEKYKSKYPIAIQKNMNKMMRKYKKNIDFLYRSGYIKTHEEMQFKSAVPTLLEKLQILSQNIERELNR